MTSAFPWQPMLLFWSFAAALGVTLLGSSLFSSPVLKKVLLAWQQIESQKRGQLLFVRARISARTLLLLQVAGLVAGPLLWPVSPLICGAVLVSALGPVLWLKRARRERVARLGRQMEGWLTVLARALEAAPSLGDAIEVSAAMVDAPLREELEVLLSEVRLGTPLEEGLRRLDARAQSPTVSLAVSTLQVGRQTGGNLMVVLKTASASLREMARLDGVVRTKTAEGRAQAWVISAIPLPLYFAIRSADPQYFRALEVTFAGHVVVVLAVGFWVAALLSARRILNVDL
jgi:tight adherence protein B